MKKQHKRIMKDHEALLKKAEELMKQAFVCYREGDFEKGEEFRVAADGIIDNTFNESARNAMNMAALYNEGRNFGIISHVLLENAARNCADDAACAEIGRLCRYLKRNKLLSEQFRYYHALCETRDVRKHADKFVDNVVDAHDFDRGAVIAENEKFIAMMRGAGLDEMIEIDPDREALYESAEYLMYHHGARDFDQITEHKARLAENLARQGEEEEEETGAAAEMQGSADKYDDAVAQLSDTEKELLDVLIGDDEDARRAKYGELKSLVLDKLDAARESAGDGECEAQYAELMAQVREMDYREGETDGVDNCLRDACKFIEIAEVIDENGDGDEPGAETEQLPTEEED